MTALNFTSFRNVTSSLFVFCTPYSAIFTWGVKKEGKNCGWIILLIYPNLLLLVLLFKFDVWHCQRFFGKSATTLSPSLSLSLSLSLSHTHTHTHTHISFLAIIRRRVCQLFAYLSFFWSNETMNGPSLLHSTENGNSRTRKATKKEVSKLFCRFFDGKIFPAFVIKVC